MQEFSKPMAEGRTELRIGVDGRELLGDQVTGIGRYLHNFLGSRARERCEHQFVVYGNQHTRYDFSTGNITFQMIKERITAWWDQAVLARAIHQDRLDLFFSPYDKGPFLASCPLVVTFHDLLFLKISDRTGINRLLYNGSYLVQRSCLVRQAACILTVSEHSRNDLVQTFRIPAEKIQITYNGVSDRYFSTESEPQIDAVRSRYDIPPNYLLYVGNFKPHKNVGRLIQAYSGLSPDLRGSHPLVLAGDPGNFGEGLQALAEQLGIRSQVHFAGLVADADLPALYRGASLFVYPSLSEGFGLPPLEAMAAGTPVVASRATSLPEVGGDAGVLVNGESPEEIRQAMEALLLQEDLRRSCIQAGRRRAKQFTVEKTAEKILSALETVAGESR